MANAYRQIFAVPGTAAFSSAGLVARLATAMTRFGIVAMLSQQPGEYALAGAVTATHAIAYALVGPRLARAVDRHGQRRVLLPAAAVGAVALTVLALCHRLAAPSWTLFLAAAVAGVIPNVGSMVRARWAEIFRGTDQLHPAYSLESVVDETVFTLGPVLAIGLSTAFAPEAGLLAAAGLLALGSWLLAGQRATEPPVRPAERVRSGSAIRNPGLPALVVTFLAIGAVFASIEVITVAFAAERGDKAMASWVLAVYAIGSALAGLVYGGLTPRGTVRGRLLTGTLLMTVTMVPLLVTGNLLLLGVVLFVAGTACAPTMATAMGMVELAVPRGQLTEGMTWASTGLGLGIALGAALAGAVVDRSGAGPAFAVPVACGALAVAAVLAGVRAVPRTPAEADPSPVAVSA
ncbi:MFS family permease [Kitasatospora gansuensis]|uniref:MFS family permease n=1 Tax=Kitasatospora gansuensis TaxID=258050 RepID=A0A7W7SC24_9ACTN|nr:MFS transporter [Kitasatospora gansuensis]MBB4947718.1 MFS family permease [Kitasatospora gansuensis]